MATLIKRGDVAPSDLRGRGESFNLIGPRTGSSLVKMNLNILRPGTGSGPYHFHSNAENIFFILEGQARMTIEGEEVLAGPGDVIFIPRGEKHDVANIGRDDLRLIEIKAPADNDFIIVSDGGE
jgi:mannose-6-phosphate isomerase-like protein (cupin superfamily)